MKKFGFTLAEVLITLGIVGVVAALTAPALVTSSRNQANAARLSVVMSNLENAFTSAIVQENVDNLYGTSMWKDAPVNAGNSGNIPSFVGNLGRYLVVNGYRNSDGEYYGTNDTCAMSNNGGKSENCVSGGNYRFGGVGQAFAITTKNGATVFIRTFAAPANFEAQKEAAIAAGSSYYTNAADVMIDVNGTAAPNTFGRDMFFFQVGENGILYPYGGRDVSRIEGVAGTWSDAGTRFSCTNESKGTANVAGMGCTARVIDEGYQMNY